MGKNKDDTKTKDRMNNLKQELEMDEHQIKIEELFERYEVDAASGLTFDQVQESRKIHGENCLTPPPTVPEWIKFCKQLFGGFSILLWIGAILCWVAYVIEWCQHGDVGLENVWLGFILAGVVIISGVFSYYQVSKSHTQLKNLSIS